MKKTDNRIRLAEPHECGKILEFICALAEYEKMSADVVADEALIYEWLFEKKIAECVFISDDEGNDVGFALYFHNFSTFLGRAGVYLEDVFVYPQYRSKGYGKALLRYIAQTAVERGCGRVEWSCLDWNAPSIAFYRSLGAVPMDEWTTFRLSGDALVALADEEK